ncbi:hypothetical protein JTE90_015317 [Oedothorax gibbosus]|uniref:Uncharacterized protein n=1 Tax=Oedothorax gibbosus TaxID=931172 RepID=A0AAV6VRT9_9ARAC|nr:hypothetical protein JTE90_015317 [Oedothorax gibbosus]
MKKLQEIQIELPQLLMKITVQENKSLKRFPSESEPDDATCNILPEAADVLDSKMDSLCSVSQSNSSVLEGKGNSSYEVSSIRENLNVKTASPPEMEVEICSSPEVT